MLATGIRATQRNFSESESCHLINMEVTSMKESCSIIKGTALVGVFGLTVSLTLVSIKMAISMAMVNTYRLTAILMKDSFKMAIVTGKVSRKMQMALLSFRDNGEITNQSDEKYYFSKSFKPHFV